jgi:hypothetical protein
VVFDFHIFHMIWFYQLAREDTDLKNGRRSSGRSVSLLPWGYRKESEKRTIIRLMVSRYGVTDRKKGVNRDHLHASLGLRRSRDVAVQQQQGRRTAWR